MIKAAVIGAGRIARQHLACLATTPGVQIAGVCDLSPAMAEAAAERFAVPAFFTDHRAMLAKAKPDVVHITTPPASHFALAMEAIEAGAHVLVEKPITLAASEFAQLKDAAIERRRVLVEDQNYLFNAPVRRLLEVQRSGELGDVTHVEVVLCLALYGKESVYADPNAPHPAAAMPGGVIGDFLPHLAYLAHAFAGPHRSASTVWTKRDQKSALQFDEFRALLACERATAALAFSGHTQPDAFTLRVYGTRARATANIFENRLQIDRTRRGPRPLMPLVNGLDEAIVAGRGAVGGVFRKLAGGPGSYEGLWELIRQTYRAIETKQPAPVPLRQIEEVNRLVDDLVKPENRA